MPRAAITSSSISPRRLRVFWGFVALTLAAGVTGSTATAQTPTPSPSTPSAGSVRIELVDQPVWHGPDDPLGIELQVVNESSVELEGFQLIVGIDARETTRSGLHASFDRDPGFLPSSLPIDLDTTVPASGSTTVMIDNPTSSFPTLATSAAGGVYPATIGLRARDEIELLGSLSTPLIYYPQPPETRLNLALVLPLNALPQRAPGGAFSVADEGQGLVDGVLPGGWLRGYGRALDRATRPVEPPSRSRRGSRQKNQESPPIALSVAPTPRMLEELADLADGFEQDGEGFGPGSPEVDAAAQVLDGWRELFGREEIQPVLVPYSFPDLPTSIKELPLEHTIEQISAATTVVDSVLGVDLSGAWQFPPAGRLDEPSLSELQRLNNADRLFLSDAAIDRPADVPPVGCPDPVSTFACAAEIGTALGGESTVLIADAGLTDRVSELPASSNDRLALQRFFAETSMIREEAPGIPDRVVHATIPSLWHPSPKLARRLFLGIREAPWLHAVTAEEALRLSREVVGHTIVSESPAIHAAPDTGFFASLERTAQLIDSYGTIVPPENRRIVRLKRNLLTAASRSWWRRLEAASGYISVSSKEALAEMDKISLRAQERFTFTDREGELQFAVVNETDYPVKLVLTVGSPNLTLDQSRVIETFPPGERTITVQATARTSGSFPLDVILETTDGRELVVEEITVTSTELNKVALGITLGALAFLILFYVLRALRRAAPGEESESPA